ncbi:MAG: hypothetical protein ACREP2_04840 [Rhodanobacteraceae bacterium]
MFIPFRQLVQTVTAGEKNHAADASTSEIGHPSDDRDAPERQAAESGQTQVCTGSEGQGNRFGSDLFAAPTAQERVAAEAQARDDARNGKTGNVTQNWHGTDLGAGDAPEQARIGEPNRSEQKWTSIVIRRPQGLPVEQIGEIGNSRRLTQSLQTKGEVHAKQIPCNDCHAYRVPSSAAA